MSRILRNAALMFCFLTKVFAEEDPQFSTRVWQTEDGLPQNSVQAITQTSDGYLWVGTRDGLARFDGVRFTVFDDKTVPEIQGRNVSSLCAGHDGSLWISFDDAGVTRLKDGKFVHYGKTEGLPTNSVRVVFTSADDSVWIGTLGGLVRGVDEKFTTFLVKDGLDSTTIRGLCQESDRSILIATAGGLNRFENGKLTSVRRRNGDSIRAMKAVCRDPDGNVWIGTDHGLLRMRDGGVVQLTDEDGLSDMRVRALCEDRDGTLWIGTSGGLNRLRDGKILPQDKSQEPFSEVIYTIFQDREGNIWVGAKSGLHRLTKKKFGAVTKQQGLTHTATVSVCAGKNTNVWIGTWGGGLNEWRDGKIFSYDSSFGLRGDLVLAVMQDRDGTVWASTDFVGGVNHWKNNHFIHVQKDPRINAVVTVIYQNHSGQLWIGDRAGLTFLDGQRYDRFTSADGLAGDSVKAILEDHENNLWIGTTSGLTRRRDEKFTRFTTTNGLSANYISAIFQDTEGRLWLGTHGGGLNRVQGSKPKVQSSKAEASQPSTLNSQLAFTAFTARQGLLHDTIYEILDDDIGYLWMTCPKGLFRVSKTALEKVESGAADRLSCITYGKADGLFSTEFNGVAKPAGCKTPDGRLWFPTAKGLVVVEPKIRVNELEPPVVIEEILADGKQVGIENNKVGKRESGQTHLPTFPLSHLLIQPGRGELEIHYTALSFKSPEKNRFKYKLDGVDSDWMDVGTRRTAYYNNLSPGKYQFRVLACNNDGIWNERGATLSIVLLPKFWETWWFKFLGVASFAAVMTGLYRIRIARLREIERLRVRIAADLHDDLGSRLTKIAMMTESAERELAEDDKARPHLENISATSREIIQGMDEIVWAINPKNDTLENLANYIFHFAEEFFHGSGVRCKLDVPAQLPAHSLSTETRHNLFLAVKEAMNNVVKHSAATEAQLRLAVSGSNLVITISDNGRGFAQNDASSCGNGLQNMRERLDQIGGRFDLQSKSGGGTSVMMELDLRK